VFGRGEVVGEGRECYWSLARASVDGRLYLIWCGTLGFHEERRCPLDCLVEGAGPIAGAVVHGGVDLLRLHRGHLCAHENTSGRLWDGTRRGGGCT
jgi:hypothetical protein